MNDHDELMPLQMSSAAHVAATTLVAALRDDVAQIECPAHPLVQLARLHASAALAYQVLDALDDLCWYLGEELPAGALCVDLLDCYQALAGHLPPAMLRRYGRPGLDPALTDFVITGSKLDAALALCAELAAHVATAAGVAGKIACHPGVLPQDADLAEEVWEILQGVEPPLSAFVDDRHDC